MLAARHDDDDDETAIIHSVQTYTLNSFNESVEIFKKRSALIKKKKMEKRYVFPLSARIMKEKILDRVWSVLLHPPYLADLSPSDFHLFRSVIFLLFRTKMF